LNRFGSIERIKEASLEELTAIPGVTAQVAMAIKEGLE
jgi:excinuclease UvrABC nuclease subunit